MRPILRRAEEYFKIVGEIKEYVGDDPINIMFVDFNGLSKMRTPVKRALGIYGIDNHYFMMVQANRFEEGYRPVSGLRKYVSKDDSPVVRPEEMKIMKRRNLLLIDDNLHTGSSLIGATIACLEERDGMGEFDRLFTLVDTDDRGYVAHFARRRKMENVSDLHRVLRELAPRKYAELRKAGRLDLIADIPAIHMPSVDPETVRHDIIDIHIHKEKGHKKDIGPALIEGLVMGYGT